MKDSQGIDDGDMFELFSALEQQISDNERARRAAERRLIRMYVQVQRCGDEHTGAATFRAALGDISETGCRLMLDRPGLVGGAYRIHFNPEVLDLPVCYGLCVRCTLVHESRFEMGVRFFNEVELPDLKEDSES